MKALATSGSAPCAPTGLPKSELPKACMFSPSAGNMATR